VAAPAAAEAARAVRVIPVGGPPEREPDTGAQFCLDPPDRPERLPRVRAL
jgi:hypothetical protein